MKKTYEVKMSETGRPIGLIVSFTVQAESEHNAIQIALQREPNKKVVSIREK